MGQYPTWSGEIQSLFLEPYWVPSEARAGSTAVSYLSGSNSAICLDQYENVKEWSTLIYLRLMALRISLVIDPAESRNPLESWPDEALELFRLWVNQGCRKTDNDPLVWRTRIPTSRLH